MNTLKVRFAEINIDKIKDTEFILLLPNICECNLVSYKHTHDEEYPIWAIDVDEEVIFEECIRLDEEPSC